MTPLGFAWMTYGLMKICPKIISLLEGGYNLKALAVSSEAVVETLFKNDETEFNQYIQKLTGK